MSSHPVTIPLGKGCRNSNTCFNRMICTCTHLKTCSSQLPDCLNNTALGPVLRHPDRREVQQGKVLSVDWGRQKSVTPCSPEPLPSDLNGAASGMTCITAFMHHCLQPPQPLSVTDFHAQYIPASDNTTSARTMHADCAHMAQNRSSSAASTHVACTMKLTQRQASALHPIMHSCRA